MAAGLRAGKSWRALVVQASVAEEGSPIGMLNVAFMLQRGLGYSASDRHALAYDLLLRAARLEQYYGDGLVDAAAIIYDGERYARHALCLHVTPTAFHTEAAYTSVFRPTTAASMENLLALMCCTYPLFPMHPSSAARPNW